MPFRPDTIYWMPARRILAQGDLRLVALALIGGAPRHGEIIKRFQEKTADGYSPSPGIVYPTYLPARGRLRDRLDCCSPRMIGHGQGFPRAAMNSRGERYPSGCTSL